MEKPDIRDSRERQFLSEVQWSMGEKNIILKEKKMFYNALQYYWFLAE